MKEIIGKLNKVAKEKRDESIFKDIMAENKEVDPTPDLVEGIFYLEQRSCFDRCSSKSADELKKTKIVVYDRRSLFFFDHETRFRKFMVRLTHHNLFELVIVLAIFINSMVLACTDLSDRENETAWN